MSELVLNELDVNFKNRIAERMGDDSFLNCFACGSCTASCPVRRLNEKYNPRRLIRMAILGMREEVYKSEFLWLCSYHSTCFYRCPQKVNIGAVCDAVLRIRQEQDENQWSEAPSREFRQRVLKEVPGLSACFVCGSCTAVCPESFQDPQKDPRKFIRKVNLGLARLALTDEFKDNCAVHFRCENRCPQGVKISRVMQAVRELAMEDGYSYPESLRFLTG